MNSSLHRKLDVLSLATLLVSAHYGLGFLLGTAEQAMTKGFAGSLYTVSIGLGTIAAIALAKFYWIEVEQIWTILGNRYGRLAKVSVGIMSWTSLIGIEAVQIVAAASILKLVGIPPLPGMIALMLLFWMLSLLPVEKASWIFRGLLLVNILALLYGLWMLNGLQDYVRSPIEFVSSLNQITPSETIGVSLSTILLVMIDMKCQQYLVQAKDIRTVYLGSLLAGLLLMVLAFLPSAVVIAAQHAGILPLALGSKEIIPYILAWVGGGSDQPSGIFLILALAVPALGLGSSVLRVQTKTVFDLEIVPQSQKNHILIAGVNALIALGVALNGGEIINLILYFYAAYLWAVCIPVIAYLLAYTKVYIFSRSSVRLSLILGCLSTLTALMMIFLQPDAVLLDSAELTIMILGLGFSGTGLLVGQLVEKPLISSPGMSTLKDLQFSVLITATSVFADKSNTSRLALIRYFLDKANPTSPTLLNSKFKIQNSKSSTHPDSF
jgi:SSS family solute:Na+ symporter